MKKIDELTRKEISDITYEMHYIDQKIATLFFAVLGLAAIGLVTIFVYDINFNDLQRQIDAMPHYVCHNQTSIDKVQTTSLNAGYMAPCYAGEITCEPGVEIEHMLYKDLNCSNIIYYGNESKTCLIKTTKEVCEVK